MKEIFALVFLTSINFSYSQDSTATVNDADMFSIDIIYGNYLFRNNFDDQFNTIENLSLGSPVQTIGLSLSGAYTRYKKHLYAVHYSYSQIIPQRIVINDSISSKINGFILSVNMLGIDLLPKSKIANCIVSFGFNTGRFRISGNEYIQQKNPFFSPTLSLQPKIRVGPIVFSIRGDYGFDISKKGWRSVNFTNKTNGINLNPFKQTGGILYFSIGWVPNRGIGYVLNLSK